MAKGRISGIECVDQTELDRGPRDANTCPAGRANAASLKIRRNVQHAAQERTPLLVVCATSFVC